MQGFEIIIQELSLIEPPAFQAESFVLESA
jgi:hypothetical protein